MRPIAIVMMFALACSGCSTGSHSSDAEQFKSLAIATLASHTPRGNSPDIAPITSKHPRAKCPTSGWITHGDGHRTRCPDCEPGWEGDAAVTKQCTCEDCDKPCANGGPCVCDLAAVALPVASSPEPTPLSYSDAFARVKATGEPVTLHFYNSQDGHSAPANEYAVDVSNESESFLAYWLGNDRKMPTKRTAKLYGDKVGSAEWYATHPSIVKATPAAVTQVDRSAGPTWTWPGDLRSHLASHGHSESELAGLTHEQLRVLHDNDHNAETARNGRPISPAPIQQRSGCPGGICPSPNNSYSSPRSTFGWFRRR